jgi:hypothetical protein
MNIKIVEPNFGKQLKDMKKGDVFLLDGVKHLVLSPGREVSLIINLSTCESLFIDSPCEGIYIGKLIDGELQLNDLTVNMVDVPAGYVFRFTFFPLDRYNILSLGIKRNEFYYTYLQDDGGHESFKVCTANVKDPTMVRIIGKAEFEN